MVNTAGLVQSVWASAIEPLLGFAQVTIMGLVKNFI